MVAELKKAIEGSAASALARDFAGGIALATVFVAILFLPALV